MKHLLSILIFLLSFSANADTARVDSIWRGKLDSPAGWQGKKSIDIDAGALSCYTAEMKEVINAYKSQGTYNDKDYYIFVSSIPSQNSAVQGEMPRGEHYGFIFSPNPNPKTVVHELGHGAGNLEHPFVQYGTSVGATPLLMDYSSGVQLSKFDWGQLHNPGIRTGWKDEVGEGQALSNLNQIMTEVAPLFNEEVQKRKILPVVLLDSSYFIEFSENIEPISFWLDAKTKKVYLHSYRKDGYIWEDIMGVSPKYLDGAEKEFEKGYFYFANRSEKGVFEKTPIVDKKGLEMEYSYDSRENFFSFQLKENDKIVKSFADFYKVSAAIGKWKPSEDYTNPSLTHRGYVYKWLEELQKNYPKLKVQLPLSDIFKTLQEDPMYLFNGKKMITQLEIYEKVSVPLFQLKSNKYETYTFTKITIQRKGESDFNRVSNSVIPSSLKKTSYYNVWGQPRYSLVFEDQKGREYLFLVLENEADRDKLYDYITKLPPQNPSNHIIFVNGFMIENRFQNMEDKVSTFDPFNYWEGIDNMFKDRIGVHNTIYANGHKKIETSNHLNIDNASCSFTLCSDQFSEDMKTKGFDALTKKLIDSVTLLKIPAESKQKMIEALMDKASVAIPKNIKFAYEVLKSSFVAGCALQNNTAKCFHNATTNITGFNERKNAGKNAARDMIIRMKSQAIRCQPIMNQNTVDVVCHSMGFAYALGMIEELQSEKIKIGRIYAIAPENPSAGYVPSGIEEIWQYGSDEAKEPIEYRDGVAPQAPINGIDDKSKYKFGGRAYIPTDGTVVRNWLMSHSIGNYMWIFTRTQTQTGYVKPRK